MGGLLIVTSAFVRINVALALHQLRAIGFEVETDSGIRAVVLGTLGRGVRRVSLRGSRAYSH